YAALFLGLCCYLSFGWAARRFFRRTGPLNSCQRWVLATMYATGILHGAAIIYKNHGTIWHFLVALFLFQFSLTLFWSSVIAARRHSLALFFAGSDEPTMGLLTTGPYGWVRHPFYTSYLVAWTAGVVVTNQTWLLGSLAICLAVYYLAATREERRLLDSHLANDYEAYSKRAGMFWPSLGRFSVEPERSLAPRPRTPRPAVATSRSRPVGILRPNVPVAVAANYAE
ncbi:MAG: isoprenylcysteine carboxylmethyltransferase family protein, partial [Isosphaeraceae bacterium]